MSWGRTICCDNAAAVATWFESVSTHGRATAAASASISREHIFSSGSHSEALLELFAPRARDLDLHAVPELNVAVAAGRFEQRVHAIELHDGRAVDAEKARGVELVLQVLHRFANEVLAVAHDQLRVRPAGQDVVDVRHRDEAD